MTATSRSVARYRRAAYVLPVLPLDAAHAYALARLVAASGLSRAAIIRRLILAASPTP